MTSIKYDLLPCPFCGASHSVRDIRFYDECGDLFGDLSMIHDFEHILDPSNSTWPEEWENLDEVDRERIVKSYLECIEGVVYITLACSNCGGSYSVDRCDTNFPEEGWFEDFIDEVDDRSMFALIATLDRYASETTREPLHEDLVKARDAVIKARDTWRDRAFEVVSDE